MSHLTFDLEANGLLDTATKLWVSCAKYKVNNHLYTHESVGDIVELLKAHALNGDIIVGHNIIDYDLPLLYKLYGYKFHGKVLDTLILSQTLQPKRPGGHRIEAWGERVGYPKVPILDWTKWNPEFIPRCVRDVKINELTLQALLAEGDLDINTTYTQL